jgi:hypothetical protein
MGTRQRHRDGAHHSDRFRVPHGTAGWLRRLSHVAFPQLEGAHTKVQRHPMCVTSELPVGVTESHSLTVTHRQHRGAPPENPNA